MFQELCTLFRKYACRQEQSRQRKEPAKHQMFSTASGFWKQPEFPLFRDLVLVRRKGKCFSYSYDDKICCSYSVYMPVSSFCNVLLWFTCYVIVWNNGLQSVLYNWSNIMGLLCFLDTGCSTSGQQSFLRKKTSLPSCRASRISTIRSCSNTRVTPGCEEEHTAYTTKEGSAARLWVSVSARSSVHIDRKLTSCNSHKRKSCCLRDMYRELKLCGNYQ